MKSIVDFACEIIDMHERILVQEEELNRLRKIEQEYNKSLDSSIQYQRTMQGQVIELLLNEGKFPDSEKK